MERNRIDSNYWSTVGPEPPSSKKLGYTLHGIFAANRYGACMRRTGYAAVDRPEGSYGTIIENNLFEGWLRHTTFEIKASDVVIDGNTVLDTKGASRHRHGHRLSFTDNWYENSDPLVVREANHLIAGNVFKGGRVRIEAGSPREYVRCGGGCFRPRPFVRGIYPLGVPQGAPAVNVTLDNNQGRLVVGNMVGSGKCNEPAYNTKILCHDGGVIMENQIDTTGPTSSNCLITARRLTRAEGGRGAPDLACAGGR